MNIIVKATQIGLTPSIQEYVESRLQALNKFIPEKDVVVEVDLHKTTNHHKQGEIFQAEISCRYKGEYYRVVISAEDLYIAIDQSSEQFQKEFLVKKGKKLSLLRKGGALIKKIMRRQ
jgi:ribosomal subunit interface protein